MIQPDLLKSIRKMRGLTLDEVCDCINQIVSKQALSKYERGLMQPSSKVLDALLAVYGISLEYLQGTQPVMVDRWNFRRGEILSAKEEEMMKEKISSALRQYLFLENKLGMSTSYKCPFSSKRFLSMSDMESAAEILRTKWKLGDDSLPSVCRIMEKAGIKILELDLDMRIDGISGWINKDIPFVILNKQTLRVERKRFTALHELGHLLFDFIESLDIRTKEKCCHKFASALLFPGYVVYMHIGKKRSALSLEELVELKNSYGISVSALVHRLKDLDVITDAYYNHIFDVWIKQNPTEEGWGGYPLVDHAEKYQRMLQRAFAEGIIVPNDLYAYCSESKDLVKELHIL
ncbi:helix-turn-helix domain-containing protein [Phocaeicola coprocola]|jgi:Zn-dependent peptidase ImmA (M78 family)/DNA-binding XRE family transcriptional regulator|uniref:helix-turn-helix domain-containing protein n=1 Tax=Phocaeicola coprocola TaxID=310298 RepID=UPI00266FA7C6|nr:XRE family transcriptional regulator [Phocaeicola coprocola]